MHILPEVSESVRRVSTESGHLAQQTHIRRREEFCCCCAATTQPRVTREHVHVVRFHSLTERCQWADEILDGLKPQWEKVGHACTFDNLMLSCLCYADDILPFSDIKASLDNMVAHCFGTFGQEGLEVGMDKTPWSSSNDLGTWEGYQVGTPG